MKVVGISGSLRAGSFNSALLAYASEQLPEGVTYEHVDIGQLPLYNADLDAEPPQAVLTCKEQVEDADVILLASPEYNHGVSGVLKNAIDWLSRSATEAAIRGKAIGLMGASPSFVGTARGMQQLQLVVLGAGAIPYPGAPVLVNHAGDKIEDGQLIDETTRQFVQSYVAKLIQWAGESSR